MTINIMIIIISIIMIISMPEASSAARPDRAPGKARPQASDEQ